jgi:hypothetical protein
MNKDFNFKAPECRKGPGRGKDILDATEDISY